MARRAVEEREEWDIFAGVVAEVEVAEAVEEAELVLDYLADLFAIDGLPVRASDLEVREAGEYVG